MRSRPVISLPDKNDMPDQNRIFGETKMPEKYNDRFMIYDALFSYFRGERVPSSSLINLSLSRLLSTRYVIGRLSSVPVKKIKKPVLAALTGAISEILFSEDPDTYALCDSATAYVKKRGLSGLSGFVNAIVRRAAREKDDLLKEIETKSDSEIRFSLPQLIAGSLSNDYGSKKAGLIAEAFFKRRFTHLFIPGLLEPAEKTIESLSKKGFVLKKDDSKLEGYYLERSTEGNSLVASDEFQRGLIYLMDRSSMAPAEAFLSIKESLIEKPDILDLCAAPGGKSLTFAAITHDSGNFLSCDISEEKVSLIRENTERLKIRSIKPRVNDASVFNPEFKDRFDAVICDVPCSGFGVLGRKPAIRYRHDEDSLQSLLSLQKKIVENAASYVKYGGFIIYSTCTLRKAENEDMVEYLLKTAPGIHEISNKTFFPDEGDFDGFFVSLLKKGEKL